MKKEISRNPSFTPSPKLRAHLNSHREGVTERLNNIFDRYAHLVRACALPLDDDETQVLLNVLSGSVVEPAFIEGTVAKLAMRQPFVLFKGLTFQKLCLPGAFRPGDHHNKMLRPGLCVVHASPQYL